MNIPRISTVGVRSTSARKRSFSRRPVRVRRCEARECGSATSTGAALPAPPAIGFFTRTSRRSRFVDLPHLALSPLHRILGLHALHGLGVHVDDDVLREASVALAVAGPGCPNARVRRAAWRKTWSGLSTLAH